MNNLRFFANDSFWNTPIAGDAPTAEANGRWLELLRRCTSGTGLHINLDAWTIPVYEVEAGTPSVEMRRRFALILNGVLSGREEPLAGTWFLEHARECLYNEHPLGHGPGFGPFVPWPAAARPDHQSDSHLAVIDRQSGWAWDMWGVLQAPDGGWCSFSGMRYRLDGDGVFDQSTLKPIIGESIHLYGPSRASGVPAIAGLIMQHEMAAGRIEHRLAFACSAPALLQHCFPACWTDGPIPGGIPEGAVLQLDPSLDLTKLGLQPGACTVARALQEYGAVLCDFADGATLYGEGAWSRPGMTWTGILGEEDLRSIPIDRYRFIDPGPVVDRGMVSNPHDGLLASYAANTGIPVCHRPPSR